MKKILGIILTVLFVAGLAVPSFAAKASGKKGDGKFDRIVALVVSVDTKANTMLVKEEKTGETRTIKISAKAAAKVQAGDRVRIKLKAGTDESAGVRVLKPEPVAEPKADIKVETPPAPEKK
ncbi:MAG: hypothetical protein HQL18_02470 [Candidatus Omnitrophica bacterium]|nr:hypothetical protein [Candidatus Omnitrophota bacterium]